jgi:GR25 family glycosyltransferase involved in LPS biosynthesis
MNLPASWSDVTSSKAVMIGLPKYSFRREYSASRLGAAGFTNISFFDAINGFEEDVDGALKKLGVNVPDSIRKGHKGCIYSHLAAWKQMIEENAPYRIFFEDDAIGHLDLPNGLGQKFWDATPKDFDMLYLGNMMNPNDPQVEKSESLVVKVPTYCLHAYMLTLEGAKKLWSLIKDLSEFVTIDIQLIQWQIENKINWYCWNGTWTQKCFPTFDEGLPWQAFNDVITPQKDTGLFWQNMRLGTTLEHPTLQLTLNQYSQ